jgi:hypothetical protein
MFMLSHNMQFLARVNVCDSLPASHSAASQQLLQGLQ